MYIRMFSHSLSLVFTRMIHKLYSMHICLQKTGGKVGKNEWFSLIITYQGYNNTVFFYKVFNLFNY